VACFFVLTGHSAVAGAAQGYAWSLVSAYDVPTWYARKAHATTVFDNRLWILGGYTNNYYFDGELNDVWYSANGRDWVQATANAQWSPRDVSPPPRFTESYGYSAVRQAIQR
jgi:hypothetical protein